MKHLLAFLSATLLLAGMCGCSSEGDGVQGALSTSIELSESSLSFSANGGKEKITVTVAGEWTATSSAEDWCTVKQSGSTLNVTVVKNYQTAERTATITVTSGEQEAAISITQAAGDGEYNAFTVKSTKYPDLASTVGAEIELLDANTAAIPITVDIKDDNCVWSMKVIEGADFIAANEIVNADTRKNFTLSIAENIATEAREGKVKIWSEHQGLECSYVLTIKQPEGTGVFDAFVVTSTQYKDLAATEGDSLAMVYRSCEISVRVEPNKSHYKWSAEVVEGADFVTIPEYVNCSDLATIPITIAKNPTASPRGASIKIWSEYQGFEQIYTLVLTQELSQYANLQEFAKEDELKVMSFNVYVDISASSPSGWPNRKEACFEMIRYHRPALIGMQETMYSTSWTDLYNTLKKDGYDGFAIKRSLTTNEGTGILYDTNLFEVYDPDSNTATPSSGTFWLSNPTTDPDTDGVTHDWFGAQYRRIANWILLRHKHTGKTICFINTHLDTKGSAVRQKEMQLIMQKFEEFGSGCDYWISTADYNAGENSAEMKIAYDNGLKNTRSAAPEGKRDYDRTYNGTKPTGGGVIDHVLCSEEMEVVEYHTIDDSYGVPYVSDHYPVYAIVKL